MNKSHNLHPSLFLGYPIIDKYAMAFSAVSEDARSLIIQPGDMYLQQIEYDCTLYLGKFIGEHCSVKEISLLEANVYSLLQRLTPDFAVSSSSLFIFPVSNE
ncbi:MAG: hypothetical protein WD595_00765 [Waddliaceae bacterium]